MKTLYATFDKKQIPLLPQAQFEGQIVVVETEPSARQSIAYLQQESLLGIDTETKPSFKKGELHKVALLQVSTHEVCFLFRLCKMGLPDCLKQLLSDERQLKVGLSLKDDIHALNRRGRYGVGNFLDLQTYVSRFGITDQSLQKLYANVMGGRISKSQQLTNWEAPKLTAAQQRYAATDAWACLRIYETLETLRQTEDYHFVPLIDQNRLAEDVAKELRLSVLHTPLP